MKIALALVLALGLVAAAAPALAGPTAPGSASIVCWIGDKNDANCEYSYALLCSHSKNYCYYP